MEQVFDQYWPIVADRAADSAHAAVQTQQRAVGDTRTGPIFSREAAFAALCYGRVLALACHKLAKQYQNASFLTLVPGRASSSTFVQFERMNMAMHTKNNVVLAGYLTSDNVRSLFQTPDVLELQILGHEVFEAMPELGLRFLLHLGRILLLARKTVLELLPPDKLITSAAVLGAAAR
jgi:hypothetical protein